MKATGDAGDGGPPVSPPRRPGSRKRPRSTFFVVALFAFTCFLAFVAALCVFGAVTYPDD